MPIMSALLALRRKVDQCLAAAVFPRSGIIRPRRILLVVEGAEVVHFAVITNLRYPFVTSLGPAHSSVL
jgi:hypothetical protein